MKKTKKPLSILLCALLILPLLMMMGTIPASAAEFEVNVTYTPDIYGAYFRVTLNPASITASEYKWIFYDAATGDVLFSLTPSTNPSTLYLEADVLRNELVAGKTYNVVCEVTRRQTGTTEASEPYSYTDRLKRGALKRTIDDLKGKDLSSYSIASKNAFTKALENAQAVYAKTDAETTQQAIDKARNDLIAANAALTGNLQTNIDKFFADLGQGLLGGLLILLLGPFIGFIVTAIMLVVGLF